MPLYEHVFLARQDASTQQVEELTTQMTGIVEGLGGKVVKMENWGVRSLTYRMNKNRKAHFVLLNIDGPSTAVAEVERQERISEDVIRYLTVRVEEHEEGPSAMMRKADRDRDRDDRGGGFRGEGFHHGFRGRGLGFGFYGPYGYYYDDYYPSYAYDDSYYDDGSCYVVQRRVHTKSGWRYHPVQVCS